MRFAPFLGSAIMLFGASLLPAKALQITGTSNFGTTEFVTFGDPFEDPNHPEKFGLKDNSKGPPASDVFAFVLGNFSHEKGFNLFTDSPASNGSSSGCDPGTGGGISETPLPPSLILMTSALGFLVLLAWRCNRRALGT